MRNATFLVIGLLSGVALSAVAGPHHDTMRSLNHAIGQLDDLETAVGGGQLAPEQVRGRLEAIRVDLVDVRTDLGNASGPPAPPQPPPPVQPAVVEKPRPPMSDAEFEGFVRTLHESALDDEVKIIKGTARGAWFSVEQVKQIIMIMTMDDQAAAGFAMYAHTADKARWAEVYGIMSMEQGDKLHHLLGDD